MCWHMDRALRSQGYSMEGCHGLRATAGTCRQVQLGKGLRIFSRCWLNAKKRTCTVFPSPISCRQWSRVFHEAWQTHRGHCISSAAH